MQTPPLFTVLRDMVPACPKYISGKLRSFSKSLKGCLFFSTVDFPLWTKVVWQLSNCRIDMRVGAFESLWSELTSEYPSYGLLTSRKFSASAWSWVYVILGCSKRAQNHGIWAPQRVCAKSLSMRTTKTSIWVEVLKNACSWLRTTLVTR